MEVDGVMDQENTANLDWLGPKSENGSISGVLDENPADRMLDRHEQQEDHAVHVQKKAKIGGEAGKGGNLDNYMKRVAEIVLVLAAMGRIRGGQNPSDVERELMAEARQKLACLCESLPPSELLTKDAVGALVEDLGLNRLKDQKLVTPPKTSIAEKVLLTMRKIEESREFATLPATYSSQMPSLGFAASAESHRFFHGINKFPPEKTSTVTPYGVGSQAALQVPQFSAPASVSASINTLQIKEVQQATVCKRPERDSLLFALPAPESIHFRLDAQSDGPARLLPVRANSTGDSKRGETLVSSAQSSSVTLDSGGHGYKVPAMGEGAHEANAFQISFQAIRDPTAKAFAVQTPQHPLQVTKSVEALMIHTNHADIARNVQKILQSSFPDHPNWIPPSIAYMNAPLTCQICKVTIIDVESLLVCDACEKGVHLKCLQSYNQKGVPKGEWHCPKCLISSNGKPLPPKYGRVGRSITVPKVLGSGGVPASLEKRVENPDRKFNPNKVIANGSSNLTNPVCIASMSSASNDLGLVLETPIARDMQDLSFLESGMKMDDGFHQKSCISKGRAELVGVLSGTSKEPANQQEQISDPQGDERSEVPSSPCTSVNVLDGSKTHTLEEYKKSSELVDGSESKSGYDSGREGQDVAEVALGGTLNCENAAVDCSTSAMEGLHTVDWVGDMLRIADGKEYYQSCCINGVVYKLQDHAMLCSDNQYRSPYVAKLKVLWEDSKTRLKWAVVSRCYFPSDLPEAVGRPCTPEVSEVYESNHVIIIRVGSIQGPCQALPMKLFKEENERRKLSSHDANHGLHPVFLCRWFYDEPNRLFQPVID